VKVEAAEEHPRDIAILQALRSRTGALALF
jgi:hypothetical protein